MPTIKSIMFFLLIFHISSISADIVNFDNATLKTKNKSAIVDIKCIDAQTSEITIDIASLEIKSDKTGETEFSAIHIGDFNSLLIEGSPNLPVKYIQMALLNGDKVKFDIIEQESVTKEKYLIVPGPEAKLINNKPSFEKPVMDESIYSKDEFFPSSPALQIETQYYRGLPIALIQICPIQYNPVTRQLKIFTHLKIKISTTGILKKSYSGNMLNTKLINNIGINGTLVANEINKSFALHKRAATNKIDIIIITVDSLKPVAEELAFWHKRKGYTVQIESRTSWSSSSVKEFTHDFYNKYKSEYLCIIGDHEHIPGKIMGDTTDGGTSDFYSDLDYVCFDDTGDYIPDMAKGRISIASLEQGKMVINKIINYELNPPKEHEFYKNFSIMTMYETHNERVWEEGARKVKTAEEIGGYLTNKNYQFNRIYNCKEFVMPQNHNSNLYSFGEPIPDYLRKPGFPWDGDAQKTIAAINKGSFLYYIMVHGNAEEIETIGMRGDDETIKNGKLLPFIVSNCCLIGKFAHEKGPCFTEQLMRRPDGAVGIIGASYPNSWGFGDGLSIGIVDAIWPSPGLTMKIKDNPDPKVTNNTVPVYTFGDLLNLGLLHQRETIQKGANGKDFTKYQHQIYHLFGDPTTQLWTDMPKSLNISHSRYCNVNDKKIDFKNSNTANGIITLVSKKSGSLIRSEFSTPTVSIPVEGKLVENDTLIVTVTTHNFKPYTSEIIVLKHKHSFTVLNPHFGDIIPAKSSYNIEYTVAGEYSQEEYSVSYSLDNGLSWNEIKSISSATNAIQWNVPDTSADKCLLRFKSKSDTKINFYSSNFSVARVSSITGKANIPDPIVYYSGPVESFVVLDSSREFNIKNLKYGTYKVYAKNATGEIYTDTVTVSLPQNSSSINLSAKFPFISVTPSKISFKSGSEMPSINITNIGTQKLNYIVTTKTLHPKILINEVYCGDDKTIPNGVELINYGDDIKMSKFKLKTKSVLAPLTSQPKGDSTEFTFPDNFILKAGKTCVIQEKNENLNDSTLYFGSSLPWNTLDRFYLSITLCDSSQIGIDYFGSKSYNGVPIKGTTWSGEGVEMNNPFAYRIATVDSDRNSDWKTATEATINKLNPGQVISGHEKARIVLSKNSGELSTGDSTNISINVDLNNIGDKTIYDTILIFHNCPQYQSPVKISLEINKKELIAGNVLLRNTALSIKPVVCPNGLNINYSLPEKSDVKLAIYNLQGKRIFQLSNTSMRPGNYTFSLKEQGAYIPGGMYILFLKANERTVYHNFTYVR